MSGTARLALPLAYLITTVSASAMMLAIMVTVARGQGASWAVPAVLLALTVPQIVLAPLAAPLLDKLGPRKIVAGSTITQAAILCVAAAVPAIPVIVGALTLRAAVSALDSAALMLLADRAPRSSAKDSTARAFARLDTARLLGGFIGPVIGGLAVQAIPLSYIFIVQAFATLLVGVIAARYPQVSWAPSGPVVTWWQKVKEAPTLLFRHPTARIALAGLVAAIVFTSFFSVAEVLYSLTVLNLSPLGVAILTQCFIIGRLLGARLGARVTSASASLWLIIATGAMGTGLVIPGMLHWVIAAGVGFGIAGVANAVQVASIRLIVVDAVPDDVRGRSLSTMGSVNQTAGVVGTALAAPALGAMGPAGLLIVAGCGTLAAAAISAAVHIRQNHKMARQEPAASAHTDDPSQSISGARASN